MWVERGVRRSRSLLSSIVKPSFKICMQLHLVEKRAWCVEALAFRRWNQSGGTDQTK